MTSVPFWNVLGGLQCPNGSRDLNLIGVKRHFAFTLPFADTYTFQQLFLAFSDEKVIAVSSKSKHLSILVNRRSHRLSQQMRFLKSTKNHYDQWFLGAKTIGYLHVHSVGTCSVTFL